MTLVESGIKDVAKTLECSGEASLKAAKAIIVAPVSLKLRAKVRITPEVNLFRIKGSVIVLTVVIIEAPKVRAASSGIIEISLKATVREVIM